MKLVVVIAILATAVSAQNLKRSAPRNRIISMIKGQGYPAESSTVTTQDGYMLQLIRMPQTFQYNKTSEIKRVPVLLMHGMMGSAEDFVYGGASQGLAYKLFDRGYDVFLGNARGSYYGQQHTRLDPNRDVAFWQFCWEDMGLKDLPVIINAIVFMTQQDQIKYVGHMEGTTSFYVMASELTEYVQKIERMVSMGPMAYMRKANNMMLRTIANNMESRSWVAKNLGMSTFRPSNEVIDEPQMQCVNSHPLDQQAICRNLYFLFNGYNSQQMNQTTVTRMVSRVPSGGSVREALHFAQLLSSGRFQKFNRNFNNGAETPEYDLSRVDVPVAMFYAPHDSFSHEDDVGMLAEKLPQVVRQQKVDSMTNNMDMIYSNHVGMMYNMVIEALEAHLQPFQEAKTYY